MRLEDTDFFKWYQKEYGGKKDKYKMLTKEIGKDRLEDELAEYYVECGAYEDALSNLEDYNDIPDGSGMSIEDRYKRLSKKMGIKNLEEMLRNHFEDGGYYDEALDSLYQSVFGKDENEDEDIDESCRPCGRMLKESEGYAISSLEDSASEELHYLKSKDTLKAAITAACNIIDDYPDDTNPLIISRDGKFISIVTPRVSEDDAYAFADRHGITRVNVYDSYEFEDEEEEEKDIEESRRPRGRMLREARKAKPKYFQGYHVMHADLGAASSILGDEIKTIVNHGIVSKLDEIFDGCFGRKLKTREDNDGLYFVYGDEPKVIEKWFDKWVDIFTEKLFEEMDDAEILIPNRRESSDEFEEIERKFKNHYRHVSPSEVKVWYGAITAAKRIVSEFDWDKDDDLYDAEQELLEIGAKLSPEEEEKYDLRVVDEGYTYGKGRTLREGRMLREGENKSEEFMKELVAIVEEESPFMGDNFVDVETDYNGGESWSGFINFTDGTINRRAYWMPGTYANLHLKGVDAVSSKNVAKVQKLVDSLESEDSKIESYFEDNLDKVNDMLPETAKPFKTSEAAFKWYMNFDPDEESDQYDIFGGTSHSGERKNLEVFYENLNEDINEYIQEFYGESPAFVGILVILDDDKEEGKVCRVESYVNDDLGYGREAVGAWAGKNVIGEGLGNHYIYDQSFTWKNLSDLKRNLAKHVALAAETIGAD